MKATLIALIFSLVSSPLLAESAMTQDQAYSYTMGVRLGELLKGQDIKDIDIDAFALAIGDVLKERELRLSNEEMISAVRAQQAKEREKRDLQAEENKKIGAKFLAENANKPGVETLPSGLQYRVITQGNGPKPSANSKVSVHYRGTLINGTEFDSSYSRGAPSNFSLKGVIPGFSEALSRMPQGSKWQVFIPGEMAYGKRGVGGDIGPNETLIFEMELLEIL